MLSDDFLELCQSFYPSGSLAEDFLSLGIIFHAGIDLPMQSELGKKSLVLEVLVVELLLGMQCEQVFGESLGIDVSRSSGSHLLDDIRFELFQALRGITFELAKRFDEEFSPFDCRNRRFYLGCEFGESVHSSFGGGEINFSCSSQRSSHGFQFCEFDIENSNLFLDYGIVRLVRNGVKVSEFQTGSDIFCDFRNLGTQVVDF